MASVFSIVDVHISPHSAIQQTISKLPFAAEELLESEAEQLASFLQVLLSLDTIASKDLETLLVNIDERVINPAVQQVRLPLCAQSLGDVLQGILLDEQSKYADGRGNRSVNESNRVALFLCYSISACAHLSRTIGIAAFVRILDTYLPRDATSDLLIQQCLLSRLFVTKSAELEHGLDTAYKRGRHLAIAKALHIAKKQANHAIVSYSVQKHPREFVRMLAAMLDWRIRNQCASCVSATGIKLIDIVADIIERASLLGTTTSRAFLDEAANLLMQSNYALPFAAAFSYTMFAWATASFADPFTASISNDEPWPIEFLDKLVNLAVACTRSRQRFMAAILGVFTVLANNSVLAWLFGRMPRPQSGALGVDIDLPIAAMMKAVKALSLFMQQPYTATTTELGVIRQVMAYIQALILKNSEAASEQLASLSSIAVGASIDDMYKCPADMPGDYLLCITTGRLTIVGCKQSNPAPLEISTNATSVPRKGQQATVAAITSVSEQTLGIASVSRIAAMTLPAIFREIFTQEPLPSEFVANLHKSIPKSLEEAISLLTYPTGQAQAHALHLLSLVSLPLLLMETSQTIVISKAKELLDSVLFLDDIPVLHTKDSKELWHTLKARTISSAIQQAPYCIGTLLIDSCLLVHKITIGGFLTGLRALAEVSCNLTDRQVICMMSTLNKRSSVLLQKTELVEPAFFALITLLDSVSKTTDKRALCCIPVCCDRYMDHALRRMMAPEDISPGDRITTAEKAFLSMAIYACSQSNRALAALLYCFESYSCLSDDADESGIPAQFLVIGAGEAGMNSSDSFDRINFSELSEDGTDISLGRLIHTASGKLATYQFNYARLLKGFSVVEKIAQALKRGSEVDLECWTLIRSASDAIMELFGCRPYIPLLRNIPQNYDASKLNSWLSSEQPP